MLSFVHENLVILPEILYGWTINGVVVGVGGLRLYYSSSVGWSANSELYSLQHFTLIRFGTFFQFTLWYGISLLLNIVGWPIDVFNLFFFSWYFCTFYSVIIILTTCCRSNRFYLSCLCTGLVNDSVFFSNFTTFIIMFIVIYSTAFYLSLKCLFMHF